MIEELDILNGVLDIKFNPYIYEYTVNVDDNINELEFSYVLNEDANIEIRNNNLDDNNTIYVDVYNIDNTITYTFIVNKENTNMSLGIDNYKKSLEVVNIDPYYNYKLGVLCIGVFFSIIIVFSIIFRKKKV